MTHLQAWVGNMDIYLLDQILKGRFVPGGRILDAGCGKGRNLLYFLQQDYDVYGIDPEQMNIEHVQQWAVKWAPADHFRVERIEEISYPEHYFDAIICNAVLHFAKNEEHFNELVHQLWRRLKPGGLWFVRLASKMGIENRIQPIQEGRFLLPDGTERFLVDADMLMKLSRELNGSWLEPMKTVLVHEQRSMTNWVLRK